MLCSFCQNALRKFWRARGGEIAHHPSLTSLVQAIEEGCFLCCTLENCFKENGIDVRQTALERCTFWYINIFDPSPNPDTLRRFDVYCWDEIDRDKMKLHLNHYSLRSLPDDVSLTRKRVASSPPTFSDFTGSDQTLSQIKEWLDICVSTHDSCGQHRSDSWMPSRVLELCDVNNEPGIRLRSNLEIERDRYLTLSHCWGPNGSQKLQLTKETLELFRQGIPMLALQQTFQDMAKVTACLGLRYFWVDCMCIMQDDPEDWRRESSLMGKVYANSWLNISATWATDSSCGCFIHRDMSRNFVCVEGPMKATWRKKTWTLTLRYDWLHHVELAPVNGRGWVVQERVLSPRIAHFTRTQVAWECQQLQASELFPDGGLSEWHRHHKRSVKRILVNSIKYEDYDTIEHYWSRIILKYTSCRLTFSTDRLIALSGIARKVHERRPSDYVAGLWSKDLPHCLLWSRRDPGPQSKGYVAPSWSWASRSGVVYSSCFKDRNLTAVNMTVLDYGTTLSNPADPFGLITDAFIKVRVKLGIARWGKIDGAEEQDEDTTMILVPGALCRSKTSTSSSPRFFVSSIELDDYDDSDVKGAYFAGVNTAAWPGSNSRSKSEGNKPVPSTQCDGVLHSLLLRRLPCSRFQRIGILGLWFHGKEDPFVDLPEQEITIV